MEDELKALKNKLSILLAQSQNIRTEMLSVNNEILLTKGAIEQMEKMLAFINNDTEQDSVEKKEEE